ncbi:small ubiquitin-related modifier 2-like [Thomomys bottae]
MLDGCKVKNVCVARTSSSHWGAAYVLIRCRPGTSFVKQHLRRLDEKPKEGVKTENNNPINMKGAGQDGSGVQFKIKRHTPLSKLMKAYYTPAQLEMEDEDRIDVFQQQTGGVY